MSNKMHERLRIGLANPEISGGGNAPSAGAESLGARGTEEDE